MQVGQVFKEPESQKCLQKKYLPAQVWKRVVRKVKEGTDELLPGVRHNHWKEEETRRADIILQDLVRLFGFDQPWP